MYCNVMVVRARECYAGVWSMSNSFSVLICRSSSLRAHIVLVQRILMFAAKLASLLLASWSLYRTGPSPSTVGRVFEQAYGIWSEVPARPEPRSNARQPPGDVDFEEADEDSEWAEMPEFSEGRSGEIVASCPANAGQDLPAVQRRVVELAYSGSGWIWCAVGYLVSTHAAWLWWCCCAPRSESAPEWASGARVYTQRAAPAW